MELWLVKKKLSSNYLQLISLQPTQSSWSIIDEFFTLRVVLLPCVGDIVMANVNDTYSAFRRASKRRTKRTAAAEVIPRAIGSFSQRSFQ